MAVCNYKLMPMLKDIPDLTWKSRVTEYFNFTREVKGSKELAGGEIVSQKKPHKYDIVVDRF